MGENFFYEQYDANFFAVGEQALKDINYCNCSFHLNAVFLFWGCLIAWWGIKWTKGWEIYKKIPQSKFY